MPNLREETYLLISLRSWCYLFLLSQAGVWGIIGELIASNGGFEGAARLLAGPELQAVTVIVLQALALLVGVVWVASTFAMMVLIWKFIIEKVR